MGKQNYSTEEWRVVGGAPFYAAAFVVSSAKHHAAGAIRDMLTSANALRVLEPSTPLLAAVQADMTGPNGDPGSTKHTPENIQRLRELLTQAAVLVTTHDPEEAEAYKKAVLDIATTAAAASKDGILGLSGERINADEQAALTELEAIFTISAT
ncbi:hypothetical protein [uncultured Arthrobacter sp.]|uniref:hypothetical protein n=1 Tax=uncultured Arthrobacter sp. TaxID=114050 RepID=UPI0025FC377D|nr:hypothetical protein [uncultured Arthrobacter sp.]